MGAQGLRAAFLLLGLAMAASAGSAPPVSQGGTLVLERSCTAWVRVIAPIGARSGLHILVQNDRPAGCLAGTEIRGDDPRQFVAELIERARLPACPEVEGHRALALDNAREGGIEEVSRSFYRTDAYRDLVIRASEPCIYRPTDSM